MSAARPAAPLLFWLLAAGVMVLMAGASRAPWTADPGTRGWLRVSLSARPDRVERCRALSDEELAARPAHMRQAVVCEGVTARYLLTVHLDGSEILAEAVTGGGARSDRPMHLLREFPLEAGSRHLSVRFALADSLPADPIADSSAAPGRETAERDRRRNEAVPALLLLDTTITIEAHRVVLLTYDPQLRRLIALSSPRAP